MVYHKFSWLKKPNLSHFEATPKVGASRSPEVHPLEFPNFWTSFSLRKTGRSFQHRRPVAGAAWRAHETLGLLGGKLEVTSCNWSCDLRSISTDQSLQQCNENFVLSGLRRFYFPRNFHLWEIKSWFQFEGVGSVENQLLNENESCGQGIPKLWFFELSCGLFLHTKGDGKIPKIRRLRWSKRSDQPWF